MSDYDSQLPIKSKQDVDERVLIKIQDGDDPAGVGKTVEVSEKKAHVRNFSKDSDGNDQQVLLSQEGHNLTNGDYDATTNKRPSSQGLIVSDRDAAPSESTMNKRPTAVVGEDDTVSLDVALRHSNGDRIDENAPLPMYLTDDPGDEIVDHVNSVNAVYNAPVNHDYTVTALKEFRSLNIACAASGRAKFELLVEDGPAAGTFTSWGVIFATSSNPNPVLDLKKPAPIAAGVIIRVVKTNLDHSGGTGNPQDLYSTINGVEV